MNTFTRLFSTGLGFCALMVALGTAMCSAEAGFWGNMKEKFQRQEDTRAKESGKSTAKPATKPADKTAPTKAETKPASVSVADAEKSNEEHWKNYLAEKPENLLYREPSRQYVAKLPMLWNFKAQGDVAGPIWIGTTYKEVALTEDEFNALREQTLNKEIDLLKAEHVAKKKALMKESDKVDDMLDEFLQGKEGDEQRKKQENEKYLVDFNEDLLRRQVLLRLVVPQTRLEPTDALYFQVQSKDLYCVDLNTSVTLWISRLDDIIREQPYETQKSVYVMVGNFLHILDKRSGFATQKLYMERAVLGLPYASESTLFLGGHLKWLYAIDPQLNLVKWQRKLNGRPTTGMYGNIDGVLIPQDNGELTAFGFDGQKRWTFVNKGMAEEKIHLEKVMRDIEAEISKEEEEARKAERVPDLEKINGFKDRMAAAAQQIEDLKYRTRSSYESVPVFDGEHLFIGSTDFNFYKINRYTGMPVWQYICGGPVREAARLGSTLVWQRDERGNLHGVDKESGLQKTVLTGVDELLSADRELVYYRQAGQLKVHGGGTDGVVGKLEGEAVRIHGRDKLLVYRAKLGMFAFYQLPIFLSREVSSAR